MKNSLLKTKRWKYIGLICLLLIFIFACNKKDSTAQDVISEFGRYEGYSEPIYDEWIRSSQYVEMRDGIKLAVDIIRPSIQGKPVDEPLPAVWIHCRYQRRRYSNVETMPPLQTLIRHGYVLVAVDVRGTGASYGQYKSEYSEEEIQDGFEITEWIASQPWSDGNVGMFGLSHMGTNQFLTASLTPPHLKAIFPSMSSFDFYNFIFPGGVYREHLCEFLIEYIKTLDLKTPGIPVDEDSSGTMLAEVMTQHQENIYKPFDKGPYRDSREGAIDWIDNNPITYLDQINASRIPVYVWGGWYDAFVLDAFQWFANLKNPKKLSMGLWAHSAPAFNTDERLALIAIEQLRWFDYWLKGIENGIMDEPTIHFATKMDEQQWDWHSSYVWPLPKMEEVKFYFSEGPSGTVESANDGELTEEAPTSEIGKDIYVTDYSTTSGQTSRLNLAEISYPDMTQNDEKGLTYTSNPLEMDVTVTGHPVVTLYISSTASDGDFFVYLEEVDESGISHYVTEGVLRASYRVLSEPPFNNMELPYHRSFKEDVKPMPKGEPVALVFDLLPVSNLFNARNRIRVTITCADADSYETNKLNPPPEITLYRHLDRSSHIVLPIVSVKPHR